ncbi:MAG: MBL fold metallo-hydrolase [Anaerolineae bacterium]|nr:MBL fold metallo-hydrolase [Anaerolineae bacterium]
MKVTHHGQNLIQLTRLGAFSCYFVREEDELTLVDTNLFGSAKAILEAARREQLPITRLVLTHAHGDHAGSLDKISELLPGLEIAFTARTARFLEGDLSLTADEPQAKLRGDFVRRQTKPTRLLTPGDQIGSLQVIAAPGHTPDHIAFLDTRDGTLIGGDAFQSQAGLAVAGTLRWLFPFPAMATWHPQTALDTARQLRRLNPSRLAVGHGKVIDNPTQAMDRAIAEAEQNLAKRQHHQKIVHG